MVWVISAMWRNSFNTDTSDTAETENPIFVSVRTDAGSFLGRDPSCVSGNWSIFEIISQKLINSPSYPKTYRLDPDPASVETW